MVPFGRVAKNLKIGRKSRRPLPESLQVTKSGSLETGMIPAKAARESKSRTAASPSSLHRVTWKGLGAGPHPATLAGQR